MSSPASRRRQRQRRRAHEKLWAIQSQLAERKTDLAAYDRVLGDISKCSAAGMLLPSAAHIVVAAVTTLRDMAGRDCEDLAARAVAAKIAAESIRAPQTSDAPENISS